MPKEFLGEVEAIFVTKPKHDSEVVQRTHWAPALIGTAKIEDEAAGWFEDTPDGPSEL